MDKTRTGDIFDAYVETLIGREGGYVNNPDDRGGETIWGITAAVAREWGYRGSMRDMPRETAKAIYRSRYWTAPRFDKVAELNPLIAEELLDTGVNMGPAVAVTFLQRALNVLNRKGADYADIAVDGRIGPATLGALAAYLRKRGAAGESVMMKALNGLQAARYIELCEKREANETFGFGWLAQRVGF